MAAILKVCAVLVLYAVVCHGVDQTRQPGAIGSEVVDAVVNLIRDSCLFADDKRFLVRLAYVQSHDGHDSKTFRNGYHGGIWQVDKSMFDEIQSNSGRLVSQYSIIAHQFGIDWSTVSWSDLRKPLYSGIAAALFTILHGGTQWRLEDQAHFYEQHFVNLAGNNFTNEAKILDKGCHGNEKLDLAFVIDRSNSLSTDDFLRAKYFIQNVVNSFDIAADKTRVAVVSYATHAKTEFRFNNHSTKSEVQSAIMAMPFLGGSTATAEAIDRAVTDVFGHVSRPDAVKVMVVITDGDANDIIDTGHAADRAQRAGITVFSIGVGSQIQTQTLNAIASNPDCTHVFSVVNYSEIKAIKEEIEKSSCKAPVYIGNNEPFCCKIGHCPILAHVTNAGGVTLESNMTCGTANIYTAFSNSNPTQSFYEQYGTVSSGNPGVMFINSTMSHTLYMNLVDALASTGGSGDCQICVNAKDGDHRDHTVKCYQNGREVVCPDNCEEKWNLFPKGLCTAENLKNGKTKFEHPFSKQKYLMFDNACQLYVVHCPQNQSYYQSCQQCVGQGSSCPELTSHTQQYTGLANPCSLEGILNGNFFYAYPPDITKFIHCDVWGKPWIMNCPGEEEWDQHELTCIVPTTYKNPCRNRTDSDPLYYPYPCDPHKYIQCDLWHQSFLRTCQLNFVFSPNAGSCVPRNMYTPPTHDPNDNCAGINGIPTHTHPPTDATFLPGTGGVTGPTFTTYSYCASCPPWTGPCTIPNVSSGDLWYPVTGNRHQYIQCDLTGHMYLKECSTASFYFDDATNTCVDGQFQVDNSLGGVGK